MPNSLQGLPKWTDPEIQAMVPPREPVDLPRGVSINWIGCTHNGKENGREVAKRMLAADVVFGEAVEITVNDDRPNPNATYQQVRHGGDGFEDMLDIAHRHRKTLRRDAAGPLGLMRWRTKRIKAEAVVEDIDLAGPLAEGAREESVELRQGVLQRGNVWGGTLAQPDVGPDVRLAAAHDFVGAAARFIHHRDRLCETQIVDGVRRHVEAGARSFAVIQGSHHGYTALRLKNGGLPVKMAFVPPVNATMDYLQQAMVRYASAVDRREPPSMPRNLLENIIAQELYKDPAAGVVSNRDAALRVSTLPSSVIRMAVESGVRGRPETLPKP